MKHRPKVARKAPPMPFVASELTRVFDDDAIAQVDPTTGGRYIEGRHLMPDPWKHRAAGMRCASCMWYVRKEVTVTRLEPVEIGRCRRHAPTMNGYPVVYPTDWCGDHKLDETKL